MALQWLVSFCPELFLCSSNHPLNPTVAVGSVPQPATVLLAVGTCCSNLLPPWPEHPLSLSICPFNIAFRPGHVAPHLIDFHPNPHPDLSLHPKHQACSPTAPSSSVCHYYTQSHTHSKCKRHDWPACLLCTHQSSVGALQNVFFFFSFACHFPKCVSCSVTRSCCLHLSCVMNAFVLIFSNNMLQLCSLSRWWCFTRHLVVMHWTGQMVSKFNFLCR